MPRPKVQTPFSEDGSGIVDSDQTLDQIVHSLDAALLDPAKVPGHWSDPLPEGQEFAIYLEGTQVERPDWSRREARRLAETALGFQQWLMKHVAAANDLGVSRPVTVPKWLGVSLCRRCHSLQLMKSGGSDKMGYCQECIGRCGQPHRSNATVCEDCRSDMEVIWKTDDEIPEEWYA